MIESPAAAPELSTAQQVWLSHLQQQQASGLSMAAYARQHGLAPGTFYNMSLKLRRLAAVRSTQASPLFQRVSVLADPARDTGAMLTLTFRLPGDIVCELRQADVASCAALLYQLAAGPL